VSVDMTIYLVSRKEDRNITPESTTNVKEKMTKDQLSMIVVVAETPSVTAEPSCVSAMCNAAQVNELAIIKPTMASALLGL